jgi:hypothetical protein
LERIRRCRGKRLKKRKKIAALIIEDRRYASLPVLGVRSDHENMDMGVDMNIHMEDHEAGTSTTDTSAVENELESPFHTCI